MEEARLVDEEHLRCLLSPRLYTLPMVRAIGRTMVQSKNYGPQITVKRLSTRQGYDTSDHLSIRL